MRKGTPDTAMKISDFFPMWEKLDKEQRALLEGSTSLRTFRKSEMVHGDSLDCTGLILVRSGRLRAYIVSEEGREITLYRLLPGDTCLLSASCIIHNLRFELLLTAEQNSELLVIPPETYKAVMEESLALSGYTNGIMASRLSDVMLLMDQVLWKSMDKRLARFLLDEIELEGTTRLKVTHEAVANHLGSAREVITRMLNYFRDEGLVKLSRGTVEVLDTDRLKHIIGV